MGGASPRTSPPYAGKRATGMQHVFVLDTQRQPLMPCRPAPAWLLLTQGKAAVLRRHPFTIILRDAKPEAVVAPLHAKFDPGSRISGLAILVQNSPSAPCRTENTGERSKPDKHGASGAGLWAVEHVHRVKQIHGALDERRGVRRSCRACHPRYRQPRYQTRRQPLGWRPPSLESRIQKVLTWVERLQRLCPIVAISYEAVCFGTRVLQQPDISGLEYQHGTPAGLEIRAYLLCK